MFFEWKQFSASVLAVLVAAAVSAAFVLQRERRVLVHRWGFAVLGVAAIVAVVSWTRFGDFHEVHVDTAAGDASTRRAKVERRVPFHFHEFFHYYLGAKYFAELGYLGLYDCTALADASIASEQNVPPRISGYVRDLEDVLQDKTYDAATQHCTQDEFKRFTPRRWAAFKADLRELQRLVPDSWWSGVVYDAGFNPPPSWVLLGGGIANVIPIRVGQGPTYLLATSLDMMLLVACFFALRSSFGAPVAVTAALFFGTSFISSYGWNGGAFLRFTWLTAVVFSLAAMKRGRWVLAGAFLGAATCDRVFPAGFAVGAMAPLVLRSFHSAVDRRRIARFGVGFAAVVVVLVGVSLAVFGVSPWQVFFSRILRHGDVYYTMHIGLKKVINYHEWVPSQNFQGHDGLANFKHWNLRLRDTWAHLRPIAIPIQLLAASAALYGACLRRPYEAALLFGVCFMFLFNIPANYYYAVLCLVPALLLRAGATAPSMARRYVEYGALTAFNAFWMLTLISSRLSNDVIVYNFYICFALAIFLAIWIGAWTLLPPRLVRRIGVEWLARARLRLRLT